MASIPSRFLTKDGKSDTTYNFGQIEGRAGYPSGELLFTTKTNLPSKLSENALIFTTDTAELFVGTGNGIMRIKLGTEADLNPRLYLKTSEAGQFMNQVEELQEMAKQVLPIQRDSFNVRDVPQSVFSLTRRVEEDLHFFINGIEYFNDLSDTHFINNNEDQTVTWIATKENGGFDITNSSVVITYRHK